MPEGFFKQGVKGGPDEAEALRRVISVGPRGEGLGRATSLYLQAHTRQFVRALEVELESLGFPFITMCGAAMENNRGNEIVNALHRDTLLRKALCASDAAVIGLQVVGFRLQANDYKMMCAEFKCRMKELEDEARSSVDREDDVMAQFHRKYVPLGIAAAMVDVRQFSEKLAIATYDFCLALRMPDCAAFLIASFAEGKLRICQSNGPRMQSSKSLLALFSNSYYRRRCQMTHVMNDSTEMYNCWVRRR